MTNAVETEGVLGIDPLDSRLGGAAGSRRRQDSWWTRHRLAAGLSATPLPGLLLVLGLALGPEGIALFPLPLLQQLEPAVAAALAAMGLVFGLELDVRGRHDLRLLSLGSFEAGLTLAVVAAGILATIAWEPSLAGVEPMLALLVAIGAAASSRSFSGADAVPASDASRAIDMDPLLPILLGGVALALLRSDSPGAGLWLAAQCALAAAALTAAGWLLLARSPGESGHVFTAGLVLLLGGVAEMLGTSALFNGLLAGVLLRAAGGEALQRVSRDVAHVQHPLGVLLLLVAGARVAFSAGALALVLAALALRLVGKLGGAMVLRARTTGKSRPSFAEQLIAPGVLAPAFALDCVLAGADARGLLLACAVAAAAFAELLALLVRAEGRR